MKLFNLLKPVPWGIYCGYERSRLLICFQTVNLKIIRSLNKLTIIFSFSFYPSLFLSLCCLDSIQKEDMNHTLAQGEDRLFVQTPPTTHSKISNVLLEAKIPMTFFLPINLTILMKIPCEYSQDPWYSSPILTD